MSVPLSRLAALLAAGMLAGFGVTVTPTAATAAPAALAVICNRHCDGRDAALAPSDRAPVTATIYGRQISLHFNDVDAMSWAVIGNGNPGDQTWLERSFDGGRTFAADGRLGLAPIPNGVRTGRTAMYNVDNWATSRVGALRACGRAGDRPETACTAWATQTYAGVDRDGTVTQGGYSTHVVVNEDFVLRVPESIPYEAAAPMLCAGITTYSPLAHWNAGPGTKVAVVGLGGLGHLAVKIAAAMGAEVTVLSQTLGKKDDGLRFGAEHYHATNDPATFEALNNSFDLIINTVSAPIDMASYLGLLRLDGTLVSVGAPPQPLPVPVFALFGNRRSFAGSSIGSIAETQEMLNFCAERGIAPEVEVIGAEAVNDAYERVLTSDVRYRFVIDIDTLR